MAYALGQTIVTQELGDLDGPVMDTLSAPVVAIKYASATAAAAYIETGDASGSAATAYTIAPGDSLSGSLPTASDTDWIRVRFEPDRLYTIDLASSGSSPAGDLLLKLYQSNGTLIYQDDDSGTRYNARLVLRAPAAGDYYISAGSANNTGGGYNVTVSAGTPITVWTVDQVVTQLTSTYWDGPSRIFALSASGGLYADITQLTTTGQQLAMWAMEAWTTVTGIVFDTAIPAETTPKLRFYDTQSGANTSTRYSYSDPDAMATLTSASINISTDWLTSYGTEFGSYSLQSFIHEIGHALGLGHPGNYNGAATYGVDNLFTNDSWQMTVMSYLDQVDNLSVDASYAYLVTPMLADIAGIRALYGTALPQLRTGNTTYGENSIAGGTYDRLSAMLAAGTLTNDVALTLVDDGGFDTLNLQSETASMRIDLTPGAASNVSGGRGNLVIAMGTLLEQVLAGSGDDILLGNSAHNILYGGDGNDDLSGVAGNDSLYGGAGNDTISMGGGDDFAGGGDGDDVIYGEDGNDVIYLGLGNDFTGGGAGNDVIYGGAGTNVIYAGLGNDSVYGGTGADAIIGGGDGTNVLLGNDGNDTITSGSGGDFLAGGAGNDLIYGGAGNDTVYAGLGNDTIGTGGGNDVVYGSAGTNVIYAGLGNDSVYGGSGADQIYGGDGANTLLGNDGNDTVYAGNSGDFVAGGAGNDVLLAGDGNDVIYLGTGNDFAGGGAGNDVIYAGAGTNRIYAGYGDDTVVAGYGRDVITGGPGADHFVFSSSAQIGIAGSRDVITDFTAGVDKIDLSAVGLQFIGAASFSGVAGELRYIPGYVVGDISGDAVNDFAIELSGAPTLTADDFIL
jgi:serralysin